MAVYEQASLALDDDFEDVRLAAIKLIWVFSQVDPERCVEPLIISEYSYST